MITFTSKTPGIKLAVPVTLLNVGVMSGFAVAGLLSPLALVPAGAMPGPASQTFALYAAARTLPLALLVLAGVVKRSWSAVVFFGLLAGLIQLADAGVGMVQHDPGKTYGPLALGLLQLYAVYGMITRHGEEKL